MFNYPLSLRNVEDLLFGRGIDICHETARLWWTRFGPMLAGEIPESRCGPTRTGNGALRWRRKFGQLAKVGSPSLKDELMTGKRKRKRY